MPETLERDRIVNAFTVDVEDYFHVQSFAGNICRRDWARYESRVVASTHKILKLLDQHQVRGTFFILGWVANRHPLLVRDIQKGGHEIGSHGYWHRLIYEQNPDQFRVDLRLSLQVLQDLCGERVCSYRAPCFSITNRSLWALDVLIEEGIQYDSSIFPIYHDNYGVPNAKRFPYRIERPQGTLWEFPPSVYRFCGLNIPVAGGGYFRMYPSWLSQKCWTHINHVQQQSFVFYIHPWEMDPEQPRLPAPFRARFRHYQNLSTTHRKLDRLLTDFQLAPLSTALEPYRSREIASPASRSATRSCPCTAASCNAADSA
jgi:polysaccharide deacetylase family protein (PEP-CTERM system associated)